MSDEQRTSGADRVREAIARDRGHHAPSQPVTLCGAPDGTERRADWTPPPPAIPLWRRVGNRLVAPVARVLGF